MVSGARGTTACLACSRPVRRACEHVFVMSAPYTELHLHSAYSFLDGASMPDELVPRALELGYRPFARHDRTLNRGLSSLAARLGVPCVATGNVHAHTRARARLQDVFVAIREHTTLDASEPLRRGNHSHVLASPAAMAARFADHPEAVAETRRLAETLDFDLTQDLGYRYPGAEDATADRRLAELCAARVEDRYPPGHRHRSEALARIEEELRIVRALGLSGFFLLHHELLELAREVAVEVRGRS